MRNELQYIERIEKYLTGAFSAEEKQIFEAEMSVSTSLTQDVLVQQQIMERIKTNAFVNDVKMFHEEFTRPKAGWFLKGIVLNSLLGLTLLGISVAGVYYVSHSEKTAENENHQPPVPAKSQLAAVQVSQTRYSTAIDSSSMKEETVCNKNNQSSNTHVRKINHVDADNNKIADEPGTDQTHKEATTTVADSVTKPENVTTKPRRSVPAYLQVPFKAHEVYATKESTIKLDNKGSVLRIPENIIVHKDGKPALGKVRIMYREFRDAADMAFSGIPMKYHGDGEEKEMNSTGMFEVRAFQNGEELEIAKGKSISIDFKVNQKLDSVYFFSLNDSTQQWTKEFPLTTNMYNDFYDPSSHTVTREVTISLWQKFLNIFRRKENKKGNYITKYTVQDGLGAYSTYKADRPTDSATLAKYEEQNRKMNANIANQTLILQNLQVSNFGVYNCDQVDRLKNRVDVLAQYIDSTGKVIKELSTVVVIDRNRNNAMTYQPGSFSCNRNGKNVLMLTGGEGRIYAVKADEFKNLGIQQSGFYKIPVTDVTDKITSLAEFRKYLRQ